MNLTNRQQQVLEFIAAAQHKSGVTPSTREIQAHFGFASQTAAVNHLRALERKGVLQRHAGKARAMALVSTLNRDPIIDIPIYGSIAAGFAELADEARDGVLSMDTRAVGLASTARAFALKVRGDSMVGAQINDGDLVVLEQRGAKNNDIVAALIDGETTLKRLVVEKGKTFLKAENPKYPDLIPLTELSVQGVMVALVRKVEG